jgi:hypothetical protein
MVVLRMAGKLPYNVLRLFDDAEQRSWVFDVAALPVDGVIAYLGARSRGLVCSEMVGLMLQAGGVPAKLAAGNIPWMPSVVPPGQVIGCSPADVGDIPMFEEPIQLC